MNAPATLQATIPTVAGTPFAGGFYVGRIMLAGVVNALILAPKADGERDSIPWAKSKKAIVDAGSYTDGRANTLAMAAAGSELAKWALALRIADGDDWYLPARDELELVYRNLKPGTYCCDQFRSGDNPSSVPPGYPYTKTGAVQTACAAFQEGAAEALELDWYWASTQYAGDDECAWSQYFSHGGQYGHHESVQLRARAVRRLPIQ